MGSFRLFSTGNEVTVSLVSLTLFFLILFDLLVPKASRKPSGANARDQLCLICFGSGVLPGRMLSTTVSLPIQLLGEVTVTPYVPLLLTAMELVVAPVLQR
ncbi:MAG: hypothetical protein CVU06_14160 [Bacteroidetes bacterium HGW-Bacteroidetes-22]|nr:MAG: hypothetical protein CVU06_14160 [Bacteroidetes bacterium HGW-Bacteroidetes-22]